MTPFPDSPDPAASDPDQGDGRPDESESVGFPRDPLTPDPRLQVIPEVLREPPMSRSSLEDPGASDVLLGAGRAWATAFDFIFTIAAGVLLGWLFDRWRGTAPWGLLAGLTLGFATALMRIIRATLAEEKREAANRKAGR